MHCFASNTSSNIPDKTNIGMSSASTALAQILHRSHNVHTANRHLRSSGEKNEAQKRTRYKLKCWSCCCDWQKAHFRTKRCWSMQKIKPIALAVIELRLSDCINKWMSEWLTHTVFTPARLHGLVIWIGSDRSVKRAIQTKYVCQLGLAWKFKRLIHTGKDALKCRPSYEMDPFLCCYLLLWLQSLSARWQKMKAKCLRLVEARRKRLHGLWKQVKRRNTQLALAVTMLNSGIVERRYWVAPTR